MGVFWVFLLVFFFFFFFYSADKDGNCKENGKQSVEPADPGSTTKSTGKHHLKWLLKKTEKNYQ